jgi:DNA-binding CsgD family transcriptional regulator
MSSLITLFREYCHQKIRQHSSPLPAAEKEALITSLRTSPFRHVVQAWSVLDFYDYKHLHTDGFDTYFGWNNKDVTEETILDMVHPQDREAFAGLYYLCLEGLVNMPIPTAGIGHFCIFYRLRDAKGKYHPIMETSNIIASDPDSYVPLVNLAQVSKLGKHIPFQQVSYYFRIKDEQGSAAIMRNYLGRYKPAVNVFTENELKIARLLKQGLTSEKIAAAIFLSKHTVDKYRKNMLEKTQCLNTPQLIAYLSNLSLV